MRRSLALVAVLALIATPILAQQHTTSGNIDTVIVASTANYPDALVASSVAAKLGIPILLTEEDELPAATSRALSTFNPSEVVIVGGEAVIDQEVETTLAAKYNVTRLWGVTRYGTAVQVAEHFWPGGSDSALLVENDRDDLQGNVLSLAKTLARENQDPIFLTPSGKIPSQVLSELRELGVSEVDVVGTGLSQTAEDQLLSLNITIDERIAGASEQAVERKLRDRIGDRINRSERFVVVGATSFRHSIASVNNPNTNAYVVQSDDEIQGAVDIVTKHSIARVKVVGNPDLAQDIAERLRAETNASVTLQVAAAAAAPVVAANFSEAELSAVRKLHDKRLTQWKQKLEQRQDQLRERANTSIAKADTMAAKYNASDDVWELITEAEIALDRDEYRKAIDLAHDAREEIREERWDRVKDNRTRFREMIEEEQASIGDAVEELKGLNRKFGRMMDENMTVEERLELIEEFRDERRGTMQELMDETVKLQDGDLLERFKEVRARVDGEIRFEAETTCAGEDAPGVGKLQADISGHDGYVRAEGSLGLDTPTYRPKARATVDSAAKTVTVKIGYSSIGAVGIQCTGVSTFKVRKPVAAGNWTVRLLPSVEGEQQATMQETVTVTPAPSDDGDDGTTENESENETEETMKTSFRLEATDDAYYVDGKTVQELAIPSGKKVTLTFHTRQQGTYYAGHEYHAYRGSSDNLVLFEKAGPNDPGESSTVTVNATEDFTVRAYWPQDGTPKAKLAVDVE